MNGTLVADVFVTLAALLGLLIFAGALRRQRPRTPLIETFIAAIYALCALMAARLLQWSTDLSWTGRATFLIAGTVPLFALLVVEALLRRHAALAFKYWVAGGALLFTAMAVFAPAVFAPVAILALALFQLLSFAGLAVMVLLRDETSLTPAENQMVNRLALSFLVILPFLLTDFRTEYLDAPVRLGGIAILTLCWLALTLEWDRDDFALVAPVLAYGFCLLGATGAVAAIASLDLRATVQVLAILASALLLAAVYRQARANAAQEGQSLLMSVMADRSIRSQEALLRAITTGGSAVVLDETSLGDFDAGFRAHFTNIPMIAEAMVPRMSKPELAEQFEWFFKKFEASHALLVSARPFRLLVMDIPVLAQSDRLDEELRVLQRLALTLPARETADG